MSDHTRVFEAYASDAVLLTEHIEYTARQTGFRPELVEKDYQCSVVLHALGGPPAASSWSSRAGRA